MNVIFLLAIVFVVMNSSWKMALALIVGGFALFIVHLVWRQESMLYVPCVMPGMVTPRDNPEGYRSPADRGLQFEDVFMTTSDSVRLHAWFIQVGKASSSAPTILFCHENCGNIGLRVPNFAKFVDKLQANIFALDYRGYGHSEGSPSEEGIIEDALCSWEWLQAAARSGRIDGRKIFLFGRSLGGAVAVSMCQVLQGRGEGERLPCGVILENTFMSISKVVDSLFPFLAFESLKSKFLRLKWDTESKIGNLEVPLLFLSGLQDEIVPAFHMEVLMNTAAKSPLKKMTTFGDGKHNDTWEKGGELYWNVQASFIQECLRHGAKGAPEAETMATSKGPAEEAD